MALIGLVVASVLAGCVHPLDSAHKAYASGDYAEAYELADARTQRSSSPYREEAHYIAGLAAHHLRDESDAVRHLASATQGGANEVTGRAGAQLALIYEGQDRLDRAAAQFLAAAPRLRGEDQARTYLQAAVIQQKLGHWSAAATNLDQARGLTRQGATRDRIARHARYSGFAVQIGAFAVESNARRTAAVAATRTKRMRLPSPRIVAATGARGRALHLVQIGSFRDYASAASVRRRLGADAVVVPR